MQSNLIIRRLKHRKFDRHCIFPVVFVTLVIRRLSPQWRKSINYFDGTPEAERIVPSNFSAFSIGQPLRKNSRLLIVPPTHHANGSVDCHHLYAPSLLAVNAIDPITALSQSANKNRIAMRPIHCARVHCYHAALVVMAPIRTGQALSGAGYSGVC